ncbi:putative ABC transporter permease [Anaerotignum propionicum]|uniref:putative ABC transporter permease n=1 Tax=Anaerotignum propionicum TaxID=28446 RepID=UPI00289DD595|nr:putative ABC transporter permease [Anaerotignum propionicum]
MMTTEIFGFTIFDLYFYFMIYSFLGWALESAYVSASNKTWTNRGFISGPLCPIYGTGATLVIVALTPFKNNLLLMFLGGVFIATVVEYVIALLLEKIFHATWWDYSQMRFQLQGRICLRRSLEWGALTVVMMHLIQPPIQRFVAWIPRAGGEFVGVLLLMYLMADASVTIMKIFQLKEKIARLEEAGLGLREKMETINLFEAKKELLDYLEGLPIAEAMNNLKTRLEEQNGQLIKLRTEERLRFEFFLSEMKDKLEKRERILKKNTLTERRIAKAFPRLYFKNYNEAFATLKEELLKKKKNK